MHKLKILLQINFQRHQQQGTRLGHTDQFSSGFATGLMGNLEQDTSHLCFPVNLLIYLYSKGLRRALSLDLCLYGV